MKSDVIVIGGGASGLMAAITAAENGKKVTIIEHMDKVGKKILMTGNGKCNYSNTNQKSEFYRCSNKEFVNVILNEFSQKDTTAFFLNNGIVTKNRNGYLYPNSGQASVVSEVLQSACKELGVVIKCSTECVSIKKDSNGLIINCIDKTDNKKSTIFCEKVILSTGGKTYLKSGSDGSGYRILKELGHKINKPLPALTSLKCSEKFCKELKGVRCDGTVYLYENNELAAKDTGEIQLTDYGISGIPVFQVSRYASIALSRHKEVNAVLDLMPLYSHDELTRIINSINNNICIHQVLDGMLNKKITKVIMKICYLEENKRVSQLSDKEINRLINTIKKLNLHVTSTGDYEQAQVCTGGLDISQVDPYTLESKVVKGLYITGELLDVDGICGGYNLQWAWSTGYAAGKSI